MTHIMIIKGGDIMVAQNQGACDSIDRKKHNNSWTFDNHIILD
jgi:hypothetical protein